MSSSPFLAVLTAAVATAIVHTLAGPDHYVPFVALAKCRKWAMPRAMVWTFVCGLGHVASALLLAGAFYVFSQWLQEQHLEFIEKYRGNLAGWMLLVFGLAYSVWGIYAAIRNKPHKHTHQHENGEVHTHQHRHSCSGHRHWHDRPGTAKVLPWILFIIFAFGPCEALWPVLAAATMVGTACLVIATVLFAAVTIATMMAVVYLGTKGMSLIRYERFERYAHLLAGLAIALCAVAILLLGL